METQNTSSNITSIVSVKKFGAKGDGKSIDTQAFEDAIDVAKNRDGVLYLPKGVYVISGVNLKGVSIISDNAKIISDGNNDNRYIMYDNSKKDIKIENLTFDGSQHVPDASNSRIYQQNLNFQKNSSIKLINVNHINCPDIAVLFGFDTRNVYVQGGYCENCSGSNVYFVRSQHNIFNAIAFKNCKEHVIRFGRFGSEPSKDAGKFSTISNCSFYKVGNDAVLFELNSSHGIVSGCILELSRSLVKCEARRGLDESEKAHHITVTNNLCISSINETSEAIKLRAAKDCIVSNNTIEGFYDAISIGENSIVNNNIILSTENIGIRTMGENIRIAGNTISKAKLGVFIKNSDQCRLNDNSIESCKYGAYIGSSHNFISQNNFRKNGIGLLLISTATENVITLNKGMNNQEAFEGDLEENQFINNFGDFQ